MCPAAGGDQRHDSAAAESCFASKPYADENNVQNEPLE